MAAFGGLGESYSVNPWLRTRLWGLVQFFSLGALFVIPVLVSEQPTRLKSSLFWRSPASADSGTSSSITSRVLTLPAPPLAANLRVLELEVETRQLRFQANAESVDSIEVPVHKKSRTIASLDPSPWTLKEIKRKKDDGSWESISLLSKNVIQDGKSSLSSSFVELDSGRNEFVVVFARKVGRKTEDASYPVVVRHDRSGS